jgi:hypothetical protein
MIRSTIFAVFAALLLAGATLPAQAADPVTPAPRVPADVPPPPGIDDPGVNPVTPPSSVPGAARTEPVSEPQPAADATAPLPKPDTRLVRDKASRDAAATSNAERISASEVTTRTEGSDTIEEYRPNGRLWMVRIVPANGPVQTFIDRDGRGRLTRDPSQGPISPVYYTLYEWN